jgi:ribosomal protein L7/L12
MNKTKKRAAKRAALKNTTVTQRSHARKSRFLWPMSLDPIYKIKNLKAYREYHGCTLGQAKEAVEAAMINHQMRW